ncbi:MAG: hypothetical protein FJ144_11060 [Deltaproteobacteria bacterium]|nr:hypothetical protein [Deltaproteobacteria bacterium]
MARKVQTKKQKAAASGAGKGAKATAPKAGGKGGSDVERRWKEYWNSRSLLEDAVEKVKLARDSLQKAQETERNRRAEFDQIKRSLTTLLDVEPAGSAQPKAVQMPTSVPTPVQGGQSSQPSAASGSQSSPKQA